MPRTDTPAEVSGDARPATARLPWFTGTCGKPGRSGNSLGAHLFRLVGHDGSSAHRHVSRETGTGRSDIASLVDASLTTLGVDLRALGRAAVGQLAAAAPGSAASGSAAPHPSYVTARLAHALLPHVRRGDVGRGPWAVGRGPRGVGREAWAARRGPRGVRQGPRGARREAWAAGTRNAEAAPQLAARCGVSPDRINREPWAPRVHEGPVSAGGEHQPGAATPRSDDAHSRARTSPGTPKAALPRESGLRGGGSVRTRGPGRSPRRARAWGARR
ncbi:hypothetical protein ATJ88_0042 [Isoptericola jiangsuensis]|uniref:Uncharacterized protein n=1 Tax=Isoptericola jiangsuensis TaxID=548579 RepID=A0A2A9EQN8_9MICO|nr:hypothetical protein ATJ88_0042 [Isoptericola jiangsuensis]